MITPGLVLFWAYLKNYIMTKWNTIIYVAIGVTALVSVLAGAYIIAAFAIMGGFVYKALEIRSK